MAKTLQDWQTIRSDFTEKLRQGWIKWFGKEDKEKTEEKAYQSARDWIKAGLEPTESRFAKWLENKDYIPSEEWRGEYFYGEKQELFQLTEKGALKQEYLNDKWALIHPDFALFPDKNYQIETCQETWEDYGLTYQEAQKWIAVKFEPIDYYQVKDWKVLNFIPQEVKAWLDIGLDKWDAKFAAYLRGKNIQPNQPLNLKQLKKEFDAWFKKEKPAQEYLDYLYLKSQREKVTELNLFEKNLQGELDLSDFVNLEELDTFDNQLTKIILPKKRSNLRKLKLGGYHQGNNFYQDLSFLQGAINLEELDLRNNKFYSSLEYLKEMKQLELLDISDTDIDSGLEYLPDSLKRFFCSTDKRKDAKVKKIHTIWGKFNGTNKEKIAYFCELKQLTDTQNDIKKFFKKWQDFLIQQAKLDRIKKCIGCSEYAEAGLFWLGWGAGVAIAVEGNVKEKDPSSIFKGIIVGAVGAGSSKVCEQFRKLWLEKKKVALEGESTEEKTNKFIEETISLKNYCQELKRIGESLSTISLLINPKINKASVDLGVLLADESKLWKSISLNANTNPNNDDIEIGVTMDKKIAFEFTKQLQNNWKEYKAEEGITNLDQQVYQLEQNQQGEDKPLPALPTSQEDSDVLEINQNNTKLTTFSDNSASNQKYQAQIVQTNPHNLPPKSD